MRWILIWGAALFGILGCATPKAEAPVEAKQVNADIEQLITTTVEEGKSSGFPDLAEVRVTPPTVESKKERDKKITSLEGSGEALRQETEQTRTEALADDVAHKKADALRRQIERDRAAAAKDEKLSEAARNGSTP